MRKRGAPNVEAYWRLNPRGLPWQELIVTLSHRDRLVVDGVRRRFVSAVIERAGDTCAPFCQFIDVGRSSPSSDIDVTIHNVRAGTVIRLANELFRELFVHDGKVRPGTSMSELLDVNIYANSHYEVCRGLLTPRHLCPDLRPLPDSIETEQVLWGMLRVPGDLRGARAMLGESTRAMWDEVHALASTLHAHVRSVGSSALLPLIERSERLLDDMVSSGQNDQNQGQYFRTMSMIRAHETDAYISYGAFAHIVLMMQNGQSDKDLHMTRAMYAASFFDNLGFLLSKQDRQTDASAAKYYYRCVHAARLFRTFGMSERAAAAAAADRPDDGVHRLAATVLRARADDASAMARLRAKAPYVSNLCRRLVLSPRFRAIVAFVHRRIPNARPSTRSLLRPSPTDRRPRGSPRRRSLGSSQR